MGIDLGSARWGLYAILSAILTIAAARADDRAIYVSPKGNDTWTGKPAEANAQKTDGPVASPEKARDRVRELKSQGGGAIHVYLREGTYFLDRPLTLKPEDSGSRETPITWSAFQGEHPVLSGGRRIVGWTKTNVNGHEAWMAKLGDSEGSAAFCELWLDGKRLGRARWPHHGTLPVVGVIASGKKGDWTHGDDQFRFAKNDIQAWPGLTGGEAIVTDRWTESHLPIASIDEKEGIIHFNKRSVFQLEPADRYWIENVRECLSEPGEFYVDAKEKAVYLIAPAGVDPNRAEAVAPRLAQVMVLDGDPAKGKTIQNVTFQGLAFAHTEWSFDHAFVVQQSAAPIAGSEWSFKPDPTRSGFGQAAIGVPAAITGAGVRSCAFDDCEVSHIGTYGIEISEGCQKNRITHCRFLDLGAGAVKIGEVGVRNAENEQTFGNLVSDCMIADGGNLYPSCVAVWIGQSHDNILAHNDIHGFWYTAISIGWTWGYGGTTSQRNIVEQNHIHHIGLKQDGEPPILSDMGCVYTLGNQEGTVIRFNRFHDVAGLHYGGWGIYFDEGTTHILAENNLVYRTTHGGFHQHYGLENMFRNNILAFNRDAQIQRTRVENHRSFTFDRNVVLWDRGDLFSGDWSKLTVAFDHNTYWRNDGTEIRFAGRTWEQWRKAGMDEHSKIADPHFADPAQGDFSLTAASKDALAGFEPFDLSKVGPRK